MKEATGELNMTVVTVVAIAAVGAFFYFFIWPSIQSGLTMNTCKNICPGGEVIGVENGWCRCCSNTADPSCLIDPSKWNPENTTTGYVPVNSGESIAIVK